MQTYNVDSDKFDFDTDVTVDDMKEYFKLYNNKGVYFSMFETGLDDNRFDLIRVDPYRQYIRIFEFKSGRQDFLSDKKWQNYLEYCHTFTFVSPREAILKDDIPPGVGLMWVYKQKWKRSEQWAPTSEWIRRPRRRDLDESILMRLAFMLVYRTIWRKDDVF